MTYVHKAARFGCRAVCSTDKSMESIQLRKSNVQKQAVRQLINQTKRLLNKNYYSAKSYNHFLLWYSNLRSEESERLLIYQMGKVGSVSIMSSLEALEIDIPLYHVHALSQDGIDYAETFYRDNWHQFPYAKNLWESQFLRKQINKGLNGKDWKIITLVRDPIAREISDFFQTIDRLPSYDYKQKVDSTDAETIAKDLIRIYLKQIHTRKDPFTWFNSELKHVFNIDVFSNEFQKLKGYKIYEGKHVEVLLLKLESLNQCVGEAFEEFLGIEQFSLTKSNTASEKSYSDIYQKFLESITLPESYIDQMYASRLAQHFYSEAEINTFKAKWRQ